MRSSFWRCPLLAAMRRLFPFQQQPLQPGSEHNRLAGELVRLFAASGARTQHAQHIGQTHAIPGSVRGRRGHGYRTGVSGDPALPGGHIQTSVAVETVAGLYLAWRPQHNNHAVGIMTEFVLTHFPSLQRASGRVRDARLPERNALPALKRFWTAAVAPSLFPQSGAVRCRHPAMATMHNVSHACAARSNIRSYLYIGPFFCIAH